MGAPAEASAMAFARRRTMDARGRTADDFSPTPSLDAAAHATVSVASTPPTSATAIGHPVQTSGALASALGLDRSTLEAAGFDGEVGAALALPIGGGHLRVAVGIGDGTTLDAADLRDAAASFARAASRHELLALELPRVTRVDTRTAARAAVEGVLLARYRYDALRSRADSRRVRELTLIVPEDEAAAAAEGAREAQSFATATMLARDLANTPHNHLSASRLADVAAAIGRERGFEVEVFDEDDLREMGIGGLLGVNAGSAEPPRMVRLTYRPTDPRGRLAFVGKGIMYDSGGIALKPADQVHAQMKNDMSGAAAILAAVAELAEAGCRNEVTGYLMCTDSMPSGTAMALGDVITMRGGTTVEVVNTDAEGRLVMADALVLAHEARSQAIVDIATLTGATMRALGNEVAGVFGNHQGLVDQVIAAARQTDEKVWQLPLHRPYRRQLGSTVADLKNLGSGDGGAITAALFLAEFVGDTPWAHLDIAGVAQVDADTSWRVAGCSGYGARLLLQLALDFQEPQGPVS
jgi:leucyl aminopeptidase